MINVESLAMAIERAANEAFALGQPIEKPLELRMLAPSFANPRWTIELRKSAAFAVIVSVRSESLSAALLELAGRVFVEATQKLADGEGLRELARLVKEASPDEDPRTAAASLIEAEAEIQQRAAMVIGHKASARASLNVAAALRDVASRLRSQAVSS